MPDVDEARVQRAYKLRSKKEDRMNSAKGVEGPGLKNYEQRYEGEKRRELGGKGKRGCQ